MVSRAWKIWLMIILMAAPIVLHGAVVVKSIQTTNTQAVIRYIAPTTSSCTVEVSEAAGYSPLVHDVNPSLFTGADLDSRTGAITNGRQRTFVVGQRKVERNSADTWTYSRALQTATLHYYRITCGVDTATGTFVTQTVPNGTTRLEIPYTNNTYVGYEGTALNLNRDIFSRSYSLIDPHTGVYVKNVSIAGDSGVRETDWGLTAGAKDNAAFSTQSLGTNWTNASGILASGGTAAGYDGASCSGPTTCDGIAVNVTPAAVGNGGLGFDYWKFYLAESSGSDASAENRKVIVCWAYADESTCNAAAVNVELTLPTSSGEISLDSHTTQITLNRGGFMSLYQSSGNSGVGRGIRWIVRKKTNVGTISLGYAKYGVGVSAGIGTGGGGNNLRCSKLADAQGFFYCTGAKGGFVPPAYRIHGDTGEVRSIGIVPPKDNGAGATVCADEYGGFHSPTDPTKHYCSYGNNLYQQTYTGNGTDKGERYTGYASDWTDTLISSNIPLAMKNFTEANAGHYPRGTFSNTQFSACVFRGIKNNYLIVHCLRGNADTYAWIGVLDMNASNAVVAAMSQYDHPRSRWCSIHSYEEIGDQNVHMYTTQVLSKGPDTPVGGGPYYVQLSSAVLAGDSTISVNSINPTSAYPDTNLMLLAVGDVLLINNAEYVRVTSISGTGPYTLGVTRALNGKAAQDHNSGVNVLPFCSEGAGGTRFGALMQVWDFVADPYGEDTTGTNVRNRTYGGHQTTRRNKLADGSTFNLAAAGQYIIRDQPSVVSSYVLDDPKFANQATGTPGLSFQTHPSFHNELESGDRANWWVDVRPLVGGAGVAGSSGATLVGGTSRIYTWTRANSSPAGPSMATTSKLYPNVGHIGLSYYLRNISGPGSSITDSDYYTWCEAYLANECRSGSSVGTVYLNPGPNTVQYLYCTGGETFTGTNVDTCLFPSQQQHSALMQFGAVVDVTNRLNSRVLARAAMGYSGRGVGSLLVAKALATGNWILGRSFTDREDLVLIKTPPLVVDSRARNTWQKLKVDVGNVPAGTNNVVVEFGYDTNFYCNENRAEKCIANAATVTDSNPYKYPVEGTGGVATGLSGVSCASGCTVELPLLPGRVAYYRVIYRAVTTNATIATGSTNVVAVP